MKRRFFLGGLFLLCFPFVRLLRKMKKRFLQVPRPIPLLKYLLPRQRQIPRCRKPNLNLPPIT